MAGVLLVFLLFFGCITESTKTGFSKLDCANDCNNLDKTFFKYNYSAGGYGPNIVQCWCKDEANNVQQVW